MPLVNNVLKVILRMLIFCTSSLYDVVERKESKETHKERKED